MPSLCNPSLSGPDPALSKDIQGMPLSSAYPCTACQGVLPVALGSFQDISSSDLFRSQSLVPSYPQTNDLVGSGQLWLLSYLATPP